ncbi:MAG: sigma-70 family RNA polymerase sigma factor [Phycisphaerales bacterium]|nr:MAG: sigma-70 family RNA polymerase sigma factor [Phycisphaerales bacterium]
MSRETQLTRLLDGFTNGDPASKDELFQAVYGDLQAMAERRLREMFGPAMNDVTIEPAALVNETYLRLIQQQNRFANREQFFAIITKVMLRVLIDYQRMREASKRPNHRRRVSLSISLDGARQPTAIISLEEFETALGRLEAVASRKADVVKMRVIWSMTHEQIATALEVSVATVERDWVFGKSWMLRELERLRDHNDPDHDRKHTGN